MNISSSMDVKIRPATAAVVPHYMRSKTDTLHHSRTHQQQVAAEASEKGITSSNSPQQKHHQAPRELGVFHTTYEVSFSPPRAGGRPLSCPPGTTSPSSPLTLNESNVNNMAALAAHRNGFGGPQPLPAHVNPASLREKQKYLNFTSRDAPPPTAASRYIIDFQHHMRNTSKAEVSRNVRKTEPPNLEKIFRNPDAAPEDDDELISVREQIKRRNQRLKAEDEERQRQHSLLYKKADYHNARRNHHGGAGATTVASVLHTGTNANNASSSPKRSPSALQEDYNKRDLFTNSPERYRKAFFNQKQFDKFAPEGWDRVARTHHEDRLSRLNQSWQGDWTQSVSPYEMAATMQKGVNTLEFNKNRAAAAGVKTSAVDDAVSRRQHIDGPEERRDVPNTLSRSAIEDLKQQQFGNHANNNRKNNNNNNNNNKPIAALPKSVRDKLANERTPNDVVMQYAVDPVLRMELIERQRNWRDRYDELSSAYNDEVGKKKAVLKEIEDLQKHRDKFDKTASSLYLV